MSVAAGGNNVWALDDAGSVYLFNANSLQFDRMPGSLAWISVGGGNLVFEDAVWGGTSDNHIFYWYSALKRWQECRTQPTIRSGRSQSAEAITSINAA